MEIKKQIELNGRTLSISTGKFAKQADGAVMVRYGDTMVLATVVSAHEPNEGQDYFPLQVEYREKTAAAGKIPGGFFKREGRPTEKEILSSRLIDRPIRPLFPDGYMNETQLLVTVYSSDQENDSDVLGGIGASAALLISDVPWNGPISEVRIGRVDGQWIVNPTYKQLDVSDIDVIVAGTSESVVMVEGESREISEEDMLQALKVAHDSIKQINEIQIELAREAAKTKREFTVVEPDAQLVEDIRTLVEGQIRTNNRSSGTKEERSQRRSEIEQKTLETLAEKYPEQESLIKEIIHDIEKSDMREMILSDKKRLDGRGMSDIRPITCEVGLLPRTHGSALFTRGETQSLTTMTLGTKMDQQLIEGLLPESMKRFMLHYNFPPFSVGEVGRVMGPGRREIGHGNLAERALKFILPQEKDFAYTIRIVSDILESNGSSSMATVCAGSLALMDGGVPVKKAVAGIAMGLIKEDDRVAVLSDILGDEDHLGDMDFKVAGTQDGITSFQMDIKIEGISFEIMEQALHQAKDGRMHILEVMNRSISEPRTTISQHAPSLITITIPVASIGGVIGPGGKTIRNIIAETGTEINIDQDGTVTIAALTKESGDRAREIIEKMTEQPEVGKIYEGTVKRLMDFGAFVEFLPGTEGLVHISQLDTNRVEKVSDVVKLGDKFEVKLMKIDSEGRYNLSRKAVITGEEPGAQEDGDGRERRRDRGDRDRRRPRRPNRS
jgi:polyribonucleotide nucleotidyltransferase